MPPSTIPLADKRLKVAWLHSHFHNWMGGTIFVYQVIKRLQDRCDVTVFVEDYSDFAKERFDELGVELLRLSGVSSDTNSYWLAFPLYLRREKRMLRDRLVGFNVTISSMFPMNWLAAQVPVPTVQLCYEPFAHFYDYDMINSMSFGHRLARNFLRRFYGRYDQAGVRQAAAVLTLSSRNAAWIEEIYGRQDAEVTYEGVDTEFFRPTAAPELAARYKGRKLIMHSTDFSPIKGTEHLIRALPAVVSSVPETKLLITSTMSGTGKQNAERLAEKLGVAGNIEYLGFLAADDVPKYYSLADVVIQPSINQTMSLSVKEAMACETPVIRSTDTTEEVIDGVSGYLVDPRDTELLAQRTITVLRDEGLAARMGRAGRQRIVEFFTWEALTDKIWAALSSAATGRRQS